MSTYTLNLTKQKVLTPKDRRAKIFNPTRSNKKLITMALNECHLLKSIHRKIHINNLVNLIEHTWREGVIKLTQASSFYVKHEKRVVLDVPIEYAEELKFQLRVSGFTVIYPEVILKS